MTLVSPRLSGVIRCWVAPESLLGRAAKLLDEPDERRPFTLGQAPGGAIHRVPVMTEDLADALGTLGGQRNDPTSSVGFVGAAHDQPPFLESIDRSGDRTAGELDALTNGVDRLRSAVEQQLQDRKVREAHVNGLEAALGMHPQRSVRLREH
jgi:hypothetical protein